MRYLDYLQIRFRHLGRGWQAGDCMNLLLLFYASELGIELEDPQGYPEDWSETGREYFLESYVAWGFYPVEVPQHGDVVLFQVGGKVLHCGVVLDPRAGTFLHTGKGGTHIQNYLTTAAWAQRVYGFYRHIKR